MNRYEVRGLLEEKREKRAEIEREIGVIKEMVRKVVTDIDWLRTVRDAEWLKNKAELLIEKVAEKERLESEIHEFEIQYQLLKEV